MNKDSIIDIIMPKMGESVTEGTIIKWNKKVGDEVKRDEIIYEISTDKVDTEVPSPAKGVLVEILFEENQTVEVGTVVARLATDAAATIKAEPAESKEEKVLTKTEKQEVKVPAASDEIKKEKTKSKNKFFSPVVMNIASKENISIAELESISGSGINGRVTKKDVLKYLSERKSRGEVKTEREEQRPTTGKAFEYGTKSRVEVVPMDNIRKKIMTHMIQSRDTSVHVSEVMEVDMSVIENFIRLNKARIEKEENIKLTYMPFISHAVVRALKKFPLMNASIEGENILMKNYINLGIAVALEPNGLIVPNIKNAENLSLLGLAKSIVDLSLRARTKKLLPDDVADGTFSITNYGVFGALFGTPIINQPEVGILGVGAVRKIPVVIEHRGVESIGIKPMMFLSLSHDHRLVDGMLGGKFLKYVKEQLENFNADLI